MLSCEERKLRNCSASTECHALGYMLSLYYQCNNSKILYNTNWVSYIYHFTCINAYIIRKSFEIGMLILSFYGWETEAPSVSVTHPRSWSSEVVVVRFEPRVVGDTASTLI